MMANENTDRDTLREGLSKTLLYHYSECHKKMRWAERALMALQWISVGASTAAFIGGITNLLLPQVIGSIAAVPAFLAFVGHQLGLQPRATWNRQYALGLSKLYNELIYGGQSVEQTQKAYNALNDDLTRSRAEILDALSLGAGKMFKVPSGSEGPPPGGRG
jgi:hypothetical protein